MPDVNNPNASIGQQNIGGQVYNVYGDRKIPKILGGAPFMPDLFIGREGELEAVHQELFEGDNLLLLVNGQGGIGKSTLAAKYWQRYEADYQHLAWVFSQSGILDALLLLSLPLGVTYPDAMPNEERVGVLLSEMRRLQKPCLLVIDNANDLNDLKKYYVALRSCPNFHLLLTTRITEFEQAKFHEIKPLRDDDAIALFVSHYKNHDPAENDLLLKIFTAVGHNTLVVELLAKNLARHNNELQTRYRLADLLTDLQGQGVLALSQSAAVLTAYQAAYTALREEKPEAIIAAMYDLGQLPPQEAALLAVVAVLPAENIPFDTLKKLLPDSAQLDTGLLALAQKGWLDFDGPARSFKISPVVQEVVKQKSDGLLDVCRPMLQSLIRELNPEVLHLDNYKHSTRFVRYAEAAVDSISGTDFSLVHLCQCIGNFYSEIGDLNKCMQAFQKMADIQTELLTLEPENLNFKNGLALSYEKLGETYASLGNLPQSLTFFEEELRLTKEIYDAHRQNVEFKLSFSWANQFLGITHASLGKPQESLKFFNQMRKLLEELNKDYPNKLEFKNGLATSYSKLGETHLELGNQQLALAFFEQSNELEKELCEIHKKSVSFKNGLAISYEKLGLTHIALGNLQQALNACSITNQMFEELYEAYPQNVSFKNGLAISYERLGETHTALGSLRQALTFFEERCRLGKELHEAYPQNVSFKNGLAVSYSKLGTFYRDKKGDKQKAKEYFQHCHALWKELSEDYPAYVEFQKNFNWAKRALEGL